MFRAALMLLRHGASVVCAAGLWLVVLDRLGLALVGGHVWPGARGIWLLVSGHFAPVAVVSVVTLVVQSLVERGRWSIPWVRATVATICLMLPLAGLYLVPVADASPGRLPGYPIVQLVTFTLLVALGAAILAGRQRRWWHYGLWAPLSVISGVVDACMYPGLVREAHLSTYSVTVMTATWGVGLPVAKWLQGRDGPAYRSAVPVATLVALLGWAPLWKLERGASAAVSPQLERLLRKLPDPDPPNVLVRALAEPAKPVEPARSASRFPRGAGRWSVLWITVDALRADAILEAPQRGAYLTPSDTPFLNEWLETTFRFVAAYSQSNSTIQSFRSAFQAVGAADFVEGANIPRIARAMDLTTAGVAPAMFLEDDWFRTGLREFERIDFYDLNRQEQQVERLEDVLYSLDNERFFIWTHFYCTHDPFYTSQGPEQLSIKGPFEARVSHVRYRAAVRWLDAQLARVARALKAKGRDDSTVVVIAADHGEHVGDGLRVGHGDGMHREEIHVPLAIHVPGVAGGVVQGVVGNIDILPTIVDLLGGAPEPTHRGQSLVPLMIEKPLRSNRQYHIGGYYEGQHAVVTDDDLVVYDEQLGAFQRFSRRIGAEHGRIDSWGQDRASDARLASFVVRNVPAPFLQELTKQEVTATLNDRLTSISGSTSNADLDFIVGVASRSPDAGKALDRAFEAGSLSHKLRIIHQRF